MAADALLAAVIEAGGWQAASIEGVECKRVTCMLLGHNWTHHRYEATDDYDQPEGTYHKCVRCGKINESGGLPGGPMAAGF
jgi:hypothetical protein